MATIHKRNELRDNLFEMFPDNNRADNRRIDEIAEFRDDMKSTWYQECSKFEPDHDLLRVGVWPFKRDKNRGKSLESINDNYLTIILATSIYADYNLPEYDEALVKGLVGEIITRKPYLMANMIGKTWPEIRDMLITGYRPTHKLSTKMLQHDCEWPLPGWYQGKHISKIPEKVLISTLCVNSYCCPTHDFFKIELAEWIIQHIQNRMGDQ